MEGQKPTAVNPFEAAAAALKSGGDIEQAVYGKPGSTAVEDNSVKPSEPKPEVQVLDAEAETVSVDSFREPKVETPPSKDLAKDAKAKAEKVEKPQISPDAQKVKQYELGMRKFQAERDQALKDNKSLKENWDAMETAFADNGIAGIIGLLSKDPDAYKKHIEAEVAKVRAREAATPAQKAQMDYEERLAAEARERAKLEREFKKLDSNVKAEKEKAELAQTASVVNPIYEKYRFTGKLGDEEAEYIQDKALWRETMEELDKLPDEEISREVIEATFKKHAEATRRVINRQAETKVKKTLETKKAAAQESAATKAMSGMQTSAATDEFRSNIRSGNIADAFRALTTGKIRLS